MRHLLPTRPPCLGRAVLPFLSTPYSPLLSTVLLPGLPSPLPPQNDSQFQVSHWRVLPSHQQGALEIHLPSSPESLTPPALGLSSLSGFSPSISPLLPSLLLIPLDPSRNSLLLPRVPPAPARTLTSLGPSFPSRTLSWDSSLPVLGHSPPYVSPLPSRGSHLQPLLSSALLSPLAEPFLSWSLAL